jgi:hypothetical protein
MVQKTVSRKKERRICFFAVSCSLHASACDLAASLDSSWFAGQYPDGSFITSDKSLAPWEFLRGISDHVESFSFRKGSSNSRGVLGVVTPSAVFRSVIFGAFASRQQLFTFVVSMSVLPSASVYQRVPPGLFSWNFTFGIFILFQCVRKQRRPACVYNLSPRLVFIIVTVFGPRKIRAEVVKTV